MILDRRPIREFAALRLRQQGFDFAAQFGIGLPQHSRAFAGRALASCVVQFCDLPESLRTHTYGSDGRPIVRLSSRSSQALARPQSRSTVRSETFRTAAISSSVNPPK